MELQMSDQEYKSPSHKLIKFFEESRDKWEKKAKERRREIRDLKARIRDLEVSRNLWKDKAETVTEQIEVKEEKLQDMQQALEETKAHQEALQKECEEFKKNSGSYRAPHRLQLLSLDHSHRNPSVLQY